MALGPSFNPFQRRYAMGNLERSFNQSKLSRFLNRPEGRVFRIAAGVGFIIIGYIFRFHVLGVISMIWGLFPLSAGLLDICYVSLVLGGPASGKKIRELQGQAEQPGQ